MAKLGIWIFSTSWRGRNAQAAHDWAQAGFPVFPCRSADAGQIKAKRPLVTAWETVKPRPASAVYCEWRRWPDAIPGIHAGAVGYIILDLDIPKTSRATGKTSLDGRETWAALIEGRDVPPIPTVITPSGGMHLWFRMPRGLRLGNRTGRLAGSGIDIRGIGGYVIAPGAVLPDGREYKLADGSPPLSEAPELPGWLVEMIEDKQDEPAQQLHLSGVSHAQASGSYAFTAFDREIADLASTARGGRNQALNTAALRLYGLVQQGQLDRGAVDAALREACTSNGYIKDDGIGSFRATCNSAWGGAQRKPRQAPKPRVTERTFATQAASAAAITPDDIEEALRFFRFRDDPVPAYRTPIIKHVLPRNGIGLMGGQSRAGKSFIAVDLATAISSGQDWLGYKVRTRIGVAYLAAEGGGAINRRLDAAAQWRGINELLPITWATNIGDLLDDKNRAEVIADMKRASAIMERRFGYPIGLVIIDTLSAAFGIENENDSREARRVADVKEEIEREMDAFVLTLHHIGKDHTRGLRGSSGFMDNYEQVFKIVAHRDEETDKVLSRDIALIKNKEGEELDPIGFELASVKVGIDEDGEDILSAAIKMVAVGVAVEQKKSRRTSQAEKTFLQSLKSAMKEAAFDCNIGDGEIVRAAAENAIKFRFKEFYPNKEGGPAEVEENLRKQFANGRSAAINYGLAMTANTLDGIVYWPA